MARKTDNFSKFINKKRNSAVKEEFKQEKKAAKKERKDAIERHYEEKRRLKGQIPPSPPTRAGKPTPTPIPTPSQTPSRKPFPHQPPHAHGRPPKAPFPSSRNQAAPARSGKPASASSGKSSASPSKPASASSAKPAAAPSDQLPLNKYIAHGGICSRRDAADLIRQGKVLVNGQPVTEPGTKVSPADLVKVNGKKVTMSRNFVYILLNKPKDYITTTDDPMGRKTVLDLIRHATTERVYPIGRLDRNTSGVLLLTNDGDLAQKLAHPKHEIKKIYHVTLDRVLIKADFDKIVAGVTLDDGLAYVDVIAYADARDKAQIGLEIHSGRNRIVRRIFEHLGYDVRGLDRVMYAGLTKKNVQRSKWRLLTEKEIRILKYMNSSIKGSHPTPAKNSSPNSVTAPRRSPDQRNANPRSGQHLKEETGE